MSSMWQGGGGGGERRAKQVDMHCTGDKYSEIDI